jgi:hypothetical protein
MFSQQNHVSNLLLTKNSGDNVPFAIFLHGLSQTNPNPILTVMAQEQMFVRVTGGAVRSSRSGINKHPIVPRSQADDQEVTPRCDPARQNRTE